MWNLSILKRIYRRRNWCVSKTPEGLPRTLLMRALHEAPQAAVIAHQYLNPASHRRQHLVHRLHPARHQIPLRLLLRSLPTNQGLRRNLRVDRQLLRFPLLETRKSIEVLDRQL
ncbi:hypothetical protein GCK32_019055 [Trichostrongylus colubriformis]|uniref:Uncharacterized protein n=1 Tax=Trichostrongylus colubriformis TaxID=6319 RepID=A0AAN8FMH4_TRICO